MSGGGSHFRIGGITDSSSVDWYSNIALVIFFSGCNFRCPYCQNSSLIPLNSGEKIELEFLRQRISMNMAPVPLLDAVVLSGGEPLLQFEGVMNSAKIVKEFGLKLMLDTNGSRPKLVEKMLNSGLADRIALDVKAPLTAEEYGKVIGLPLQGYKASKAVGETLDLCNSYGVEVEVRTTVAPTISDEPHFIKNIASSVKDHCTAYYLQQFDNTGNVLSPSLKQLDPPSRKTLTILAKTALVEGVENVFIKTRELGLERVG